MLPPRTARSQRSARASHAAHRSCAVHDGLAIALGLLAAGASLPSTAAAPGLPAATNAPAPRGGASAVGCLAAGNGYLRARIRGAVNLDVDWHNAQLECEGGPREDGSGFRLSFAGPLGANGKRLRLVFGIRAPADAARGRALPTNLTVIFEGEQRWFATRGDDKCQLDRMRKEPLRAASTGSVPGAYRVVARGFCVEPATALSGGERILVSRFDFAGRLALETRAPRPPLQLPTQPRIS